MKNPTRSFFDIYSHNFLRVAIAAPHVHLAAPLKNATEIARLHALATKDGAALVLFPELSLSGYSLDDLHQQDALLGSVLEALSLLLDETSSNPCILIVGAPLRLQGRLFNCAVLISSGRILGIVPKSYVPNYREFYEKRQFAAARDALSDTVTCLGHEIPFGAGIIFRDRLNQDFCVHAEICEDVWTPIPPSSYAALAGATILVNLSASNITIGKSAYRRQLALAQSAKTISAYLYSGAGSGESTSDLAWDGHTIVCENGEILAESKRFSDKSQLVFADIDLDRLTQERARMTSLVDCATDHGQRLREIRIIPFSFSPSDHIFHLKRNIERFPFVPTDKTRRDDRCYEAYNIQVSGLVQRLRAAGVIKVVIGVSGGLDSSHALIVAARAMDRLGLPRQNVLAYTMPGYATSAATHTNALDLMKALRVSLGEIDVRPSCKQMFKDIAHPFASGKKLYDVTFENVQAGERTNHLFRLANHHSALVVGTGDLSELALGWCTYGVGDHMSHYNVNASVPKTLIRYLIEWVADHKEVKAETARVLRKILSSRISPELIPGEAADGPSQDTEEAIGPYDLHDFSLYYITRRGYIPSKVIFLATHAWANDLPFHSNDTPYGITDILKWQRVFLERFFLKSQFKRSAIPNGPKVGSGGSLSPRGDWRAPSDNMADPWLKGLDSAADWIRDSL
ncbi:Glutamine-dependent NAD(+) synthetase [uncultured Desulfobacterium sp.]|uniref:Glutamine-dependent NAD(+) synthetase n=1 Tax=uncultured Desulfobacterium sp. TaxID=201089 RepID=A0A445MQR3_9BACT|nr:Glutamine-dependent NAD(+) synthetase [uncultured Desulfobacterium sp.]